MIKISDRFDLAKKLGQGTFSYIYEAYDKQLEKNVALKIEKKDKNKSILIFEYNVLKMLNGLSHVCCAYDFVKNSEQNLIVMDLLGNNLAKVRKCLEDNYNFKVAIQLLIEMLDSIEEVHDRGFIHRDVKASNFVLSRDNKHVYIVDFGLAKKHLDEHKNPVPQRKKADFRGTVSFASLNAHNNIDLSRRDDLWSLYFVILDFLNEKLKWREQKEYTMDEVKHIKTECLNNPEEKLWIVTKDIIEVKNIFHHLKSLSYKDQPNYLYIRNQLKSILSKNIDIPQSIISSIAPAPNSAAIPGQRLGSISQFIIQQHPQAPFTIYNHQYNGSKSITIGNPTAVSAQQNNNEFQTPERPQNHQRLLQLAAANGALLPNQQNTPITPQNNNDDGAFPKSSPHHLITQVQGPHQGLYNINFQHNFSQQLFTTNLEQRKQQIGSASQMLQIEQQQTNVPGSLSQGMASAPTEKRTQLKRKNQTMIECDIRNEEQKTSHIQQSIQSQTTTTKKTKQVIKIEKKGATKKRDTKKNQNQITVVQDEQPINISNLIDQQPELHQGQVLQIPQNNVPIFQFSPSNANCVNQQIQISQNFFLSPHFLLLLNDQNDKHLYQQAAIANAQLQQVPSTAPTAQTLITRPPSTTVSATQQFPQLSPEVLNPQGMIPMSLHQQGNVFNKIAPQMKDQAVFNLTSQINSNLDPILEEKMIAEDKQAQQLLQQNQAAKAKAKQEVQMISDQYMNVHQNQMQQYHFSNNFSSMTTACRNSKRQQNQAANPGNYLYDPQRIEIKKQPCFKVEKVSKVDQKNVKSQKFIQIKRQAKEQIIVQQAL